MSKLITITKDGILKDIGPIDYNKDLNSPTANGIVEVRIDDAIHGLLQQAQSVSKEEREKITPVIAVGRSGHSQIGLQVEIDNEETIECSPQLHKATVPIKISTLGKIGNEEDFRLSTLEEIYKTRNVNLLRLLISLDAKSLSADDLKIAMEKNLIWLPEDTQIDEDGTAYLSLTDVEYILSSRLMSLPQNIRDVIQSGKHALGDIQDRIKMNDDRFIGPGELFVGASHLSIGNYTVVIDRDIDSEVFHLAASVLDGIRTTGRDPRQMELYNKGNEPKKISNLRIPIKFYPSPDPNVKKISDHVFIEKNLSRINKSGVTIDMIANLQSATIQEKLFKSIDPIDKSQKYDNSYYGRIISEEGVINVGWERTNTLQNTLLTQSAKGYIDPQNSDVNGLGQMTQLLKYVGGNQSSRRLLVSSNLPTGEILRNLSKHGIGVFIGKGIDRNGGTSRLDELRVDNNVYFDASTYKDFLQLSQNNTDIFMIFDKKNAPELRKFHKGFWIKPDVMEKLDKVETIVAMFGSHVDGLEAILSPQIDKFMKKLHNHLGEKIGICHGKGPGVMKIADEKARENNIASIGIGIDVEKIGQKPNFKPDAMADFTIDSRHSRQNILDSISTIKIYNVGGQGTLEEAAIALTNTKILEGLAAPFIFVDPTEGLGKNGTHLFTELINQLETMAEEKRITIKDKETRIRLLSSWATKYCYLVNSYDAAFDIIKEFAKNPAEKWESWGLSDDEIKIMSQNVMAKSKKTGFQLPDYILNSFNKYPLNSNN